MKIGIGGFSCECCTFSPLPSTADDFTVLQGDSLLKPYTFLKHYPDIIFKPLVRARALPGGFIERNFYDRFKAEFLEVLNRSGPFDGLFLHMHGAAHVEGLDDTEGDFMTSIRDITGPDCVIAASYDLHGNVSETVFNRMDLLTAYRTAPHRDVYDTLERTCNLLVRCLRSRRTPHRAFVPLPILLTGEQTSTDWEPGKQLYSMIPDVIDRYNLLDASILIGFAWADEPRSGASVITLGHDRDSVEGAAEELAEAFWDARRAFDFGSPTGTVDECIRAALDSKEYPVILSDSGDNPTAGSAGDIPFFLQRLLALNVPDAVVAGIADAGAVAACVSAGPGRTVNLSLGGKLDPVHGAPLQVTGTVLAVYNAPFPVAGHSVVSNPTAVIAVRGIRVIVTSRRTPFHRIRDFEQLGIVPFTHRILVIKIGYLEPELQQIARRSWLALSPGAVNQDIIHLPFRRIRRPMFPLDPGMVWTPSCDRVFRPGAARP